MHNPRIFRAHAHPPEPPGNLLGPFVISRSPVRLRRVALRISLSFFFARARLTRVCCHFATTRRVERVDSGLVPHRKPLPVRVDGQLDRLLVEEIARDRGLWAFHDPAQRFWSDRSIPDHLFPARFRLPQTHRCHPAILALALACGGTAFDEPAVRQAMADETIRIVACPWPARSPIASRGDRPAVRLGPRGGRHRGDLAPRAGCG